MKRKYFIWGAVILLLSNMCSKPIMYFIEDDETFRYSNIDGSLTHAQKFGFNDAFIDKGWWCVSEENPRYNENCELYRLYKINPLCFWRWYYYLMFSTDFEYKNWEKEIEPFRVPRDSTNFLQAF